MTDRSNSHSLGLAPRRSYLSGEGLTPERVSEARSCFDQLEPRAAGSFGGRPPSRWGGL